MARKVFLKYDILIFLILEVEKEIPSHFYMVFIYVKVFKKRLQSKETDSSVTNKKLLGTDRPIN